MIPPLAVTLGDSAGIGPEIVAKAWKARELHSLPPFFAVGDPDALSAVWDGPVRRISDPAEAGAVFADALPLLGVERAGTVTPGRPDQDSARGALDALEQAVRLAIAGAAGGVVTAPVGKAELYRIGFTHPGQTEFVAERCGVPAQDAVMMLAGPTLRVVPLTVHVPLQQVSSLLTRELVIARARVCAAGLRRDFGIDRPRLAVAGINPHAGESGELGREEVDVLAPAIRDLRAGGIDAVGPFAADAMFHARARAGYDAALCPTHDQALIPIKTLHFDEGVNITLGLPIVRTSPDHGTAFGIAGRDQAHPGAMIAAIRMAAMAATRRARAPA